MLAQPLYINSMASVHPVFDTAEPDYKELIPNAAVRRRMSRIVRMGVAAGLQCLADAPTPPDAILTATGLGCLTDTEKFMNNLLDMNEELLPPTAFIQSTFNTVGAQIALLTKNHCYNNTYVHRTFSLESALLDASLLFGEGEAKQVLVGAVDEMNPTLHKILERFGYWKHFQAGEGADFFLLSNKRSEKACAVIQDIEMFSGSYTEDEIEERMERFFTKNRASNIHVLYPEAYKQYCGEYPTAMGFVIRYACRNPELPYTAIYNSSPGNHSFVLLKHL